MEYTNNFASNIQNSSCSFLKPLNSMHYRQYTFTVSLYFMLMMAGKYFINVLEPRLWTDTPVTDLTADVPMAFRQERRRSQHIAFLRDFFRCYKDFSTEQLDTLEILLEKLYLQFHITDQTDFSNLKPEDYPILSDLFKLAERELECYDDAQNQLYTKDTLRSLTLGLRSISVGAESRFFNDLPTFLMPILLIFVLRE